MAQSFNDFSQFVKSPVFTGASSGTLFVSSGKYYYKTPGGGLTTVSNVAQLQDLAKQGIVRPGSDVQIQIGTAPAPQQPTQQAPVPTQPPQQPPTPTSQVKIYGPSGAQQTVMATDLPYWQGQGWSQSAPAQAPSGAGPTGTDTTGTDVQAQRDSLKSAGIDTTGLDDTQVAWLSMMNKYQQVQAANDKNIAPPSLSAADVQKYTEQATAELGPQFQAALGIDKTLVGQTIADQTKDYSLVQQQTAQAQSEEMKAQAASMAESGLAYSGLRKEAEQKLQTSQTGLVTSQRSQYEKSLRDQAQALEQKYGAQGATMAQQLMGQAGLTYTPIGVKSGMGTAEQIQSQNVIARTGQLEQAQLGGQAATTAAAKPLQPLTSI